MGIIRFNKVLVVAPGRRTRGGITSVIKAYSETKTWKHWRCHWVQTHIDRGKVLKILYFLTALLDFSVRLPFAQIIHIHLSNPVSAIRKSFFYYPARLFRKKIIIHLHTFSVDSSLDSKYSRLYKKMLSGADVVIVLSELWKREVQQRVPEANIKIIYNPAPNITQNGFENRESYILYAGTLNKRKGYEDLIRAFANINPVYPDWHLKMAGNGEIEQARAIAEKLGVTGQIDFLGWVSGDQKDEIFGKASLFCLPSYAEGFPMAVIDAFAYGVPVITTPVGGLPDLLRDGDNAILFNPGEIDELSKKLKLAISDVKLRNELVMKQNIIVENFFSLRKINNDLNLMYFELTHG